MGYGNQLLFMKSLEQNYATSYGIVGLLKHNGQIHGYVQVILMKS